MDEKKILSKDFYTRSDVVKIARELLGKVLVTKFDGVLTSGIISEAEAYAGVCDRASHAYGGKNTSRTSVMFQEGGYAYIYLCYGVHSLFNVVTNISGVPHAVLIRGILPLEGVPLMLRRCAKTKIDRNFTAGPGKVAKALGLHFSQSGQPIAKELLNKDNFLKMWIEDRGYNVGEGDFDVSARIGVAYAGMDALLPYRFVLKKNAS